MALRRCDDRADAAQGGLRPFRWRRGDEVPHRGQPEVFDFEFELMMPSGRQAHGRAVNRRRAASKS